MCQRLNGQWDAFFKDCEIFVRKSESKKMKLLILCQKVKIHCRRSEFIKAGKHFEVYERIIIKLFVL